MKIAKGCSLKGQWNRGYVLEGIIAQARRIFQRTMRADGKSVSPVFNRASQHGADVFRIRVWRGFASGAENKAATIGASVDKALAGSLNLFPRAECEKSWIDVAFDAQPL